MSGKPDEGPAYVLLGGSTVVKDHITRFIGLAIIAVVALAALFAPVLAPNGPDRRFTNHLNAPPTLPRLWQSTVPNPESRIPNPESVRGPFIYPWRLVNRLEQRYELDRSTPIPLVWFSTGKLVRSANPERAPLLLVGADRDGRDI
ncbi:MAG: hypothetical protein ACRD1Q_16725, partial [Vicinamibacterales bacterium]